MCFFSLDFNLVVQLLFGFILVWSSQLQTIVPTLASLYRKRAFKRILRSSQNFWEDQGQTWRPCSQEHYTNYTTGGSSRDLGVATREHRSLCSYHQVSPYVGTPSLLLLQAGHLSAMLPTSPPQWIPYGDSFCTPTLFWEEFLHGCCWLVEPRSRACKVGWGFKFLTSLEDVDSEGRKFLKFGRSIRKKAVWPQNMTNYYTYLCRPYCSKIATDI